MRMLSATTGHKTQHEQRVGRRAGLGDFAALNSRRADRKR
jgi:hypothetical protein